MIRDMYELHAFVRGCLGCHERNISYHCNLWLLLLQHVYFINMREASLKVAGRKNELVVLQPSILFEVRR